MIISPIKAIESGWVKGEISKDSIQPNGIDFRLMRLFYPEYQTKGSFVLLENTKKHINYFETVPYRCQVDGLEPFKGWFINGNSSVDFLSNLEISLPRDVAAIIIQRSTLNRNGCTLTSGFWDSGFKGTIGGQLHNHMKTNAYFEVGVRIGQVVFMEASAAHSYNGQYQSLEDHWAGGGK